MRKKIIQAIKNFNIEALSELLDDAKPYMDVPKSLFLKALDKKFESAKEEGCHSFDEVFFGICESCNKGCEGMSFYANSGFYLDLFMEGDKEDVTDIYVCNKLLNFTDLEKLYDLGPSFGLDEAVLFKPNHKYINIDKQYQSLLKEIENLEPNIKLDELVNWYNRYAHIRDFVDNINPFVDFDYKLYSNADSIISDLNNIIKIKAKASHAIDALITFQKATTEREKLIWFFKNRTDIYGTYNYILPADLSTDSFVFYKSNNLELAIDISGYEYVMDYFRKLDNFYYDLTEKYRPLPEHFEQSPTGGVEASIENYLRLHHVHLDVVEKYGGNKF